MQNQPKVSANLDHTNSPPLEGCPKGGVVNLPQQKVNNSPSKVSPVNDASITSNYLVINEIKIEFKPILNLPYNSKLKERAKALRNAENLPEVLFWMQVTKKRFHQIDFDRQRIIGNYIVDFFIKKLGLVIEIDGSSHDFDGDYDQKRENYLISLGLKIYRITVDDVMKNMDFALMGLENYIIEHYGEKFNLL